MSIQLKIANYEPGSYSQVLIPSDALRRELELLVLERLKEKKIAGAFYLSVAVDVQIHTQGTAEEMKNFGVPQYIIPEFKEVMMKATPMNFETKEIPTSENRMKDMLDNLAENPLKPSPVDEPPVQERK